MKNELGQWISEIFNSPQIVLLTSTTSGILRLDVRRLLEARCQYSTVPQQYNDDDNKVSSRMFMLCYKYSLFILYKSRSDIKEIPCPLKNLTCIIVLKKSHSWSLTCAERIQSRPSNNKF
jgi:hypothetical protein